MRYYFKYQCLQYTVTSSGLHLITGFSEPSTTHRSTCQQYYCQSWFSNVLTMIFVESRLFSLIGHEFGLVFTCSLLLSRHLDISILSYRVWFHINHHRKGKPGATSSIGTETTTQLHMAFGASLVSKNSEQILSDQTFLKMVPGDPKVPWPSFMLPLLSQINKTVTLLTITMTAFPTLNHHIISIYRRGFNEAPFWICHFLFIQKSNASPAANLLVC